MDLTLLLHGEHAEKNVIFLNIAFKVPSSLASNEPSSLRNAHLWS